MRIADGAVSARPETLRDELRRQTREAHGRVDALYGTCDLSAVDGYRRFLTAQAAAWQTMQPLLDAGSMARLMALRADLKTLGMPAPKPVAMPDLATEDLLGMRYVLEGSRLGSTLLLRDLRATAPALAEESGRYLATSADIEGWRTLSTSLQMRPRNDASAGAIISDARAIFDLFERSWWATDSEMMEARTAP